MPARMGTIKGSLVPAPSSPSWFILSFLPPKLNMSSIEGEEGLETKLDKGYMIAWKIQNIKNAINNNNNLYNNL